MKWEYGVAHRYPKTWGGGGFTTWRTDWTVIDDETDYGKGAIGRLVERAKQLAAQAESEGTGNEYRVMRRPVGEGEIVWPEPEGYDPIAAHDREMLARMDTRVKMVGADTHIRPEAT